MGAGENIRIYNSGLAEPKYTSKKVQYQRFKTQTEDFLRELQRSLDENPHFHSVPELCSSNRTTYRTNQKQAWRMEYDDAHGLFIISKTGGSCCGAFNMINGMIWHININANESYLQTLANRGNEVVEPILTKYPGARDRQEEELLK